MNRIRKFFAEIWRRHVLQVAIPYGVIGWLIIQITELVLDVYAAPDWIMQTIIAVIVGGFPVAIILAWVFDFTPTAGILFTQPAALPGSQDEHPSEPEPEIKPEFEPAPALALEMGDAERRQVTVLHCRLRPVKGESMMADPEFMQEAMKSTERIFAGIIERFGGFRITGGAEELILVFGYPANWQGEARTAIAAGLSLIAELRKAPELDNVAGTTAFCFHVGVATGLVVVEEPGSSDKNVKFIGLAPRIAAWLQDMAESDSLVIEPHTRKLVRDHYQVESLGVFEDPQFGGKSEVFTVSESASESLSLADHGPLVGRDEELGLMEERWDAAAEGEGQFILLRGEGGMGKSSLLRAFVRQVYDAQSQVFTGQCGFRDRHTPFAPVIEILRNQVLNFSDSDNDSTRMDMLEKFVERTGLNGESVVPLLARMLSLNETTDSDVFGDSPQSQRLHTIELVLDIVASVANHSPVLMVIEDLHWADASTLELVGQLIDQGPVSGLCVVLTFRPDLEADWMRRSFVMLVDMKPLSRRSALELIQVTAGELTLPESLCKRITQETDGNPMYVQELTRAVIESDQLQAGGAEGDDDELSGLDIPANLQESLAARVDNLGSAKAILQVCSVLGREFKYELLRDVSGTENESALQEGLKKIVDSELLFVRGMLSRRTYIFKHAFIQETAYNTLLKSKRKEFHGRTAEILEVNSAESGKRQTTLLAHHYTEAGNVDKAAENWVLASRDSLTAFANFEAAEQARRGIQFLESSSSSPARVAMQISLQSILGSALLSTLGYSHPEVRIAFSKALELCEQLGDVPELFRVMVGLWTYYFISGQYRDAENLGERMLRISESTGNPAQHMQARYCLALIWHYRGEFSRARLILQEALDAEVDDGEYASLTPERNDMRIHTRAYIGLFDWQLGRPVSARTRVEEAKALADEIQHPYGVQFAAFYGAWFHQMRREPGDTLMWAREGVEIAEEKGFEFFALLCNFFRAHAQCQLAGDEDQRCAGLEILHTCIDQYRLIGSHAGMTWLLISLAEICLDQGQLKQAQQQLDAAREEMELTGETAFEPELLRVQGRICNGRNSEEGDGEQLVQARALVMQALDCAQELGSRPQALSAAVNLAELAAGTGNQEEARQLLREILEQFEETDDSWYFVRANELLIDT